MVPPQTLEPKFTIGEITLRRGRTAAMYHIDGKWVTVYDPPEESPVSTARGLRITKIDYESKTVTLSQEVHPNGRTP